MLYSHWLSYSDWLSYLDWLSYSDGLSRTRTPGLDDDDELDLEPPRLPRILSAARLAGFNLKFTGLPAAPWLAMIIVSSNDHSIRPQYLGVWLDSDTNWLLEDDLRLDRGPLRAPTGRLPARARGPTRQDLGGEPGGTSRALPRAEATGPALSDSTQSSLA